MKSVFGSWATLTQLMSCDHSNCNRREYVSRPGLQHTHTYHEYLNHPAIYRTRPSSNGHEA
eukprot:1154156-Pelagomonas_calceolata.AAC.3